MQKLMRLPSKAQSSNLLKIPQKSPSTAGAYQFSRPEFSDT
jgi:hypothetical protein